MKAKKSMLGGVIFTIFAVSASAFAGESVVNSAEIQNINQTIREKGAQWKAKETWVSRLSKEELKRMLGSNERPTASLEYPSDQRALATSIDWRNKDGVNWLGKVLNQGNCGSCVAFASVGTLEAQLSISAGLPWLHPTFSPEQLFACGGGGCDSGWYPDQAAKFIKNNGIVDLACAPNTMPATGADVSCSKTTSNCSDLAARTYKISGTSRPTDGFFNRNADKVKDALKNGPVMTTMTVYTDFTAYAGGIYKHVSGKTEGGHAVSIVGYDDATRVWIVRNSWGPEWGENGFVRVSWDDTSGVGSSTWQFQVPSQNEYLTIASPSENEYVSGKYSLKVGNTASGNVNLELRAAGSKNTITTLSCAKSAGAECISALETSQLADGRYEVVAKSGASGAFTQPRSFMVANQAPQNLAIQFTGSKVDLSQPLKGRIEFDVTTQAAPVPFHHVTLIVRQNGKIMVQKTTEGGLAKMKLGFRTNTLPNGQYEILFRGEVPAAGKVFSAESPAVKVTFAN